ncbi:oligoendopeptidase F [Secundilactobacillus oryzae JCM 18671]|uniref:Oligopeptidase F n=1 Tax=Secundilactobacillus oryzae JCM 18671 TaxID=1291743 RepID=A0A081BGK1_9LACO|nr:oligoendopeptidase F [Secundilactobacillus oryzae]GAK47169.1 oligoendopeptidase F [Secundilactobacillus oryzae JCM 18671]
MVKQLPKRNEVSESMTWDLSLIYQSDAEFEAAFKEIQESLPKLASLKGSLSQGADALRHALEAILAVDRKLEKLYVYTSLRSDVDTSDSVNLALNSRAESLAADFSADTAWFEPELLALPEVDLSKMINSDTELQKYRHYFDAVNQQRGHVLSANEEKLLAGAGDIFASSSRTFSMINDSDLEFGNVKDETGDEVQLSQGVYDTLIKSTDRAVRKQAFEKLYEVYRQFRNTLASTLSGEVKTHNYLAKTHHYETARQQALSNNHIPEAVFETLVSSVNNHLGLLHRYVKLRQKVLKLDDLHMYDMYTPITGEPSLSYTYEEAKATALDALKVFGDDYVSHVKEAFDSRWIDVTENKGKRSGAYSGGAYDTAPYMLLNWQDDLDNLYTLVHEMGHSMHSWYTRHNQPYQYGDYSIFVAEIASTTNENILTDYLLEKYQDPKVRAYVLNFYLDGFKGTIFRQTQFAEFEHFIHTEDAQGNPLTSDMMSDFYGDLNARYYGDAVARDPQIALEWSRIPHFYYNYYVYQYATGFAAATALANGVVNGDQTNRDAYLTYLKSGSSNYPIDVMKLAGVDMTKPDYLEDAFKIFEQRLNELESIIG